MRMTLMAVLAVAVTLAWSAGTAVAQQATATPSDAGGQAGASGQVPGAAGTGADTADPAKIETYLQMRKYLQSQVISTTAADLSPHRDAIEKHLRAASRQWMGPDEFIEFHRQVQADPALKAMVEARMRGEAGASPSGASSSGAGPGASPQ